MSAPSAPTSSTAETKRVVIKTDAGGGGGKKKGLNNQVIIKGFRIALTLFYGQFVANGIYDNLIRTIPYLVDKELHVYSIIKVTIGILIIGLTIFSMIAIWMRQRILIFISSIVLIVLSVASLIISTIDIVQKKERSSINDKEFAADVCELCVQAVFRVAAISLQFVMIKFLKPPAPYEAVPTRA